MRTLGAFDKPIDNGGSVGCSASVDDSQDLVIEVHAKYPMQKIIDPMEKEIDILIDKVKAMVPGSWDDALLDAAKLEYKAAVLKAISG